MNKDQILIFANSHGEQIEEVIKVAKTGEVQHVHLDGLVYTIQTEENFEVMMNNIEIVHQVLQKGIDKMFDGEA